ncbi:MAG: hypothetical protein ACJAS3_001960 [Roseivirga sp.]|jgi:hypothetical protein
MIRTQILAFFISAFSLNSFAQGNQYIFEGIVTDIETDEVLPFASVFLANTTFGTVTNDQGEFRLEVDQPGSYDLIVKFVGFKTFSASYPIFQSQTIRVEVNLERDIRFVDGATVTARRDSDWWKNLADFKRGFLGVSSFANQCNILNEDKIDFIFDQENNVFEAYAKEPLIIENRALGYRIKYVLESYKEFNQYNVILYYGFPVFEELNVGNNLKRRWVRNREKAYHGSVDHFFSALYNNLLQEEGYMIQAAEKKEGQVYLGEAVTDVFSTLTRGLTINSKRLFFKNSLIVTYEGGKSKKQLVKPSNIILSGNPNMGNFPYSEISILEGRKFIEFESNGFVYNPIDYVVSGYWGNLKVADLIPLNYQRQKK